VQLVSLLHALNVRPSPLLFVVALVDWLHFSETSVFMAVAHFRDVSLTELSEIGQDSNSQMAIT
jgi:hypothetical protein